MKSGSTVSPELQDFALYVKESGVDQKFVQQMLALGQHFLLDVSTGHTLAKLNKLEAYKNKSEVFCAIAWFLMYQAFVQDRAFHKGLFIFDLGHPSLNQTLFSFFKQIGRARPSSHLQRKYDKEQGSYGITLEEDFPLPGPVKKEEGLEKLTTGLFFVLKEDQARMVFKYEDFPFDPLHHPGPTFIHTLNWLSGVKINSANVIGRREDALPVQILSYFEAFIKSFVGEQLEEYCTLRAKSLKANIRTLSDIKHRTNDEEQNLQELIKQRDFEKKTKKERLALPELLNAIDQSNKSDEAKLEAKRKAIFHAYGYVDDILYWLSEISESTEVVKNLLKAIARFVVAENLRLQENEVQELTFENIRLPFGSEVLIAINGPEDRRLTESIALGTSLSMDLQDITSQALKASELEAPKPQTKPAPLVKSKASRNLPVSADDNPLEKSSIKKKSSKFN